MSSKPEAEPNPVDQAGDDPPPRRKGPPAWGVALFLALLAGAVLLNQWINTSGPPVAWIENDLKAALAKVNPQRPRCFLYLYEPNDPSHQRNEREVFTQRWAREPLAQAVCCRVPMESDAASTKIRFQYNYAGKPLFLLLTREGAAVSATSGEPDFRQFSTYIGKPIEQALRQGSGNPGP